MEFPEHKRLIDLLPGYLQEYREFREILDTEQIELDSIHLRISDLLSDTFTETATEAGIEHREKMYGIVPREGASLEERRLAVKMKETTSLPYTIRQYRELLYELCGAENVEITLKANEYYLGVRIRAAQPTGGENLAMLRSVNLLSKQMVPANMVYFAVLFNHFEPEHTLYTAGAVSMKRNYQIPMSVISRDYDMQETTYYGSSLCSRIKQPIKEV